MTVTTWILIGLAFVWFVSLMVRTFKETWRLAYHEGEPFSNNDFLRMVLLDIWKAVTLPFALWKKLKARKQTATA